MTQIGHSNAIVNAMLGWLKGLANWVLRLFNLSGGFSPLKFLADNWLKLLVLLLLIGLAADLLVWLIRWRPHWVWFHKKRVIINDRNFFAGEEETVDEDYWELPPEFLRNERETRRKSDWKDNDFVVAGSARRRREEERREAERRRKERSRLASERAAEAAGEPSEGDVFTDAQFNVNAKQRFSDRYEDEVFSVSNLPRPEEEAAPKRGFRLRGGLFSRGERSAAKSDSKAKSGSKAKSDSKAKSGAAAKRPPAQRGGHGAPRSAASANRPRPTRAAGGAPRSDAARGRRDADGR